MARPQVDWSLYLVLDPDLCGGADGMVETTRQAIAAGVTVVQLRAPEWKKRALVDVGHRLMDVTRGKIPLIVNDHIDVAMAIGAQGVHVGQKDMDVRDVRRIMGDDVLVGLSISDESEWAATPWDLVDVVGVGPIYPTKTKKDAAPVVGLRRLEKWLACRPKPVVAIGGVGVRQTKTLARMGVDGVAVVSAVCGKPNPQRATEAWAKAWYRNRE